VSAESGKVARRKRRSPRGGVPAIVEQKERKPIAFGWGADLTQREREGLKERFALFAGIVLAVVVIGLVGWGLINDYVVKPAQQAADNNRPVAVIGNDVVRVGYFKRYEAFQNSQYNTQIQQLQQEQSILQSQKGSQVQAQLAQISQQISTLQQALANLPQTTIDQIIDQQVVLQKAGSVGVVATPKDVQTVMTQLQHSIGGPLHYQQFVHQSGLSAQEIQTLQVADWLRNKLGTVLANRVQPYQIEVRASHILLPANKHAEALSLLRQIQHGASFAALAKKYSIDSGSKLKGGDLGFFPKSKMVAPFGNEAFKLGVGQVGVVKSQFGWHIIEVTGRKKLALSATDLATQKSGALQTWITQQRAALHLQRLISPASLPSVVTVTPSSIQQTNPVTPQTVATQPVVPTVGPRAAATAKK
jgi:parvulin-like peptidyl-prolyl isomerase